MRLVNKSNLLDMNDMVFSKFTLLFLQSTGWYLVDLKYAQELTWGKEQGCNVAAGII